MTRSLLVVILVICLLFLLVSLGIAKAALRKIKSRENPLLDASQDDLLLELDMATSSALKGEHRYLFELLRTNEPSDTCLRIYERNQYRLSLASDGRLTNRKQEEPNDVWLVTSSLDEICVMIRTQPGNFGLQFFLSLVARRMLCQ